VAAVGFGSTSALAEDKMGDTLFSTSWTLGVTTVAPFALTTKAFRSDPAIAAEKQKLEFVEKNYDGVVEDIARGGGQHLESLYGLMRCFRKQDREELSARMQERMAEVVPSEKNPEMLLANINQAGRTWIIANGRRVCAYTGGKAVSS
jgi:DUF3015 family protein